MWENEKRFRGGLVFKAHRWLYHPILGSRLIKKKKQCRVPAPEAVEVSAEDTFPTTTMAVDGDMPGPGFMVQGLGSEAWGLGVEV